MILVLDAALDGCLAAVVRDGTVVAERRQTGGRGSSAVLPEMARAVLAEAGVAAADLSVVAVTVGPGSFTGVRAALALAQGIALAAGVPVRGVSLGEAMRAVTPVPDWVVIDSRRGRVFLDIDGTVASVALDALPEPGRPVSVAGDAARLVVDRLGARGVLLDADGPTPGGIALAAMAGERAAVPLYVDPAEARPGPAGRPAPT